MAIAEKLKSFIGISKNTEEIQDKPLKPLKPIDSPANVLIIDCDLYDDYYYEDFIYFNFAEEVEDNLLNFCFARDFLEASAMIQLNPPDLIVCELVLPLCQLLEDKERIYREFAEANNNFSELLDLQIEHYEKSFGYGLNVFKLLEKLDLEFTIPVVFYSTLGSFPKYRERAKELGALSCLSKAFQNNQDRPLKIAIKKALNI